MVAQTHVTAHFVYRHFTAPRMLYTPFLCFHFFDFDFLCFGGHFNCVIDDGRARFSSGAFLLVAFRPNFPGSRVPYQPMCPYACVGFSSGSCAFAPEIRCCPQRPLACPFCVKGPILLRIRLISLSASNHCWFSDLSSPHRYPLFSSLIQKSMKAHL